ncbi:hypothetical protein H5T87_09235 [bacterium]|nr:hypothetical protein [bacterium]
MKQRFDNPGWEVFTNVGERKERGIRVEGNVLYPHIVVLKMDSNELVGVGEIETDETFDTSKTTRWQMLSRVAPVVWLYVPKSRSEEARKLLKEFKLKKVLLRSWEIDENGNILITDL